MDYIAGPRTPVQEGSTLFQLHVRPSALLCLSVCLSLVESAAGYFRSEGDPKSIQKDFKLGKACGVPSCPKSPFAVCPGEGEREIRRQDLIRLSVAAVSRWHTLPLSLSAVVDAGNAAFIRQQLQRRAPLSVWGRDCWSYP